MDDKMKLNTLRPIQDGRHFPDDILKSIFMNENVWISLTISLKCVRKVRINNIPSLVQIMAWRRPGDKPLSEPMMVSLLTHICVTRPQWVNVLKFYYKYDTEPLLLIFILISLKHKALTIATIHDNKTNWERTKREHNSQTTRRGIFYIFW